MRGNDIHPRAKRRIRRDHVDVATSEFKHGLLRDMVDEAILEDDQLATLEDALAAVEDARDRRREDCHNGLGDPAEDVARSLDPLQLTAKRRVKEVCAHRCRTVLIDGDEWVDQGYREADEVAAAKQEAASWLVEHRDVAARLWGKTDDVALAQEVVDDV